MCGFVGIVNYDKNLLFDDSVIKDMAEKIYFRGPDENGYFYDKNVSLGHNRLIVRDPKGGVQPMSFTTNGITYTIVYNGQIYNTDELKKLLLENNINVDTHSDTEILLKSYILFGYDVVHHINGIFSFAIWDSKKEELFIARDHLGVKPFFYTFKNNNFIFGSEIKTILAHPEVDTIVDKDGLCELFGLGPAHTAGLTVYKDIYELKPGYFGVFDKCGLKLNQYWKLKSQKHTDDFETTCKKINYLLEDSISKQLVSDVPLGVMLSGGLDSSIITAYAANHYKKLNKSSLKTFSVDYVDNDKNFVKSDFQPNSDKYFIDLMIDTFKTEHKTITLDTPELADFLFEAMYSRDCPGMADVDSSLLLFCREIKKDVSVVLSGECSDEIFAGYPWFFREDALNSNTFPWSLGLAERQQLLNSNISEQINLKEYIDCRYNQSLSKIDFVEDDSTETTEKRKISYLTTNWFMQTLLDRTDRMAMFNGLEVRVPFCDYRLIEYLWNIPWEYKAYEGREKGLLRHIVSDLLPDEIIHRKKSPYPKTHNPSYLSKVKTMLSDIMKKSDSPIKQLLNEEYISEILETNGSNFSRPWFGQLMTGPQLMAYLCQVNMWLEKYNPKIKL